MALSKVADHVGSRTSSPGQGVGSLFVGWEKWQVAVAVGTPVVLAGLGAGFWYWRSGGNSDSGPKPSLPKSKSGTITSSNNGNSLSPTHSDKPQYMILKDQGNEMFKASKFVEALDFYSKAIVEFPPEKPEDLATLYQNRAAVFEKLGDYVQVIAECTKALEYTPKYVKALHRRSRAYKVTGFLEESLEDVTAVCILESFQVPASIQHADDVLKELGKQEADKLMKLKKPSPPSQHSVASFLRSFYNDPITKLWNQKTSNTNGELPGEGGDNEIQGYLGAVKALKEKYYDLILDFCTQEIETPGAKFVDEAYHLRGAFKFLYGFGEECSEDFAKVIESPTASNEMKASALIKQGSYFALCDTERDFAGAFAAAEKLTPDNVDVFHHLGQVMLTKGDIGEALQQIDKAAEMCPDFALAIATKWFITHRFAFLNKNIDGMSNAMRQFQKCVRKFPDAPDIYNLYGQILMENHMFQEAENQFDRVIELEPNNAAVYVHKALAQFSMTNDHEKTLKTLKSSLKVDEKNEFVWETIGTLELQAGNLEAAVVAIGKALELAKSHNELMMLSSLKKAAEVQCRIKDKLGIEIPAINNLAGPGMVPMTL